MTTRTERTYYLLTCVHRLSWSALGPTYALFLLDRGLDLLELNIVLAVYLIATCALEVPTGAVADVFGRKVSFVLSCVIRGVAFGLYYFSESFPAFLVAEIIDALGTTLATGAFDAWAVDGVRADGDERPVDRLFARGQMLGQTTAIAGGLGAAYLANYDLAWPWLVGCGGFALCAALAAWLMDDRHHVRPRHAGSAHGLRTAVADGLAVVRTSAVMRRLCLFTALGAFAIMPAFQMWQPRLSTLAGEGPWLMGWVWALINLAAIAGAALVPRLLEHFGRGTTLAVAFAWRACTLAAAGLAVGFPLALGGFLLAEMAYGVSEPVLQAWMSDHASAAQRATILSVRSMAFTLGGSTGLVCLGWLALRTDIGTAWVVSAAICLAVASCFLLLLRREPPVAAVCRVSG